MFLSVVRTKAGPLPGLTCWKSRMRYICLSSSMHSPLRKSLVSGMDRGG